MTVIEVFFPKRNQDKTSFTNFTKIFSKKKVLHLISQFLSKREVIQVVNEVLVLNVDLQS